MIENSYEGFEVDGKLLTFTSISARDALPLAAVFQTMASEDADVVEKAQEKLLTIALKYLTINGNQVLDAAGLSLSIDLDKNPMLYILINTQFIEFISPFLNSLTKSGNLIPPKKGSGTVSR